MHRITVFALLAVVAALPGCVPPPSPPINSLAFARRPPPPGQPGYLATIKYVDDGMRFTAADSGFFVSSAGEMCFLGSVIPGATPELAPHNYWCMSPFDVSTVEALENDMSYVNQVRLWCRQSSPQCAHKIAYPNQFDNSRVANSIAAETYPFRRERAAIAYLVYLMGGATGPETLSPIAGQPAAGPIPLDSAAPPSSVGAPTLATEETR
ncbi:MAG: hypothetical protein ACREE2_06960 [Stellaceae bacterium]